MNAKPLNRKMTVSQKRLWIVINYSSIVLMLVMFYSPDIMSKNKLLLFLFLIPVASLSISFKTVFWNTGLWKISHDVKTPSEIDHLKRFYIVTRISYIVFTLLIITLLFVFSITGKKVDALLSACLLYFAHILPASIMAWGNRRLNG